MRTSGAGGTTRSALVRPSRSLLAFFDIYLRWYIGKHFHALRLAHASRFLVHADRLIVYVNHPSWWDPLACMVVARHLLPSANHYAPMEEVALHHYGILRHLGLFAVKSGTPRGAAQFLRAANEILSTPNNVLWLTPQGRFTDVRPRPLTFRPGLPALVGRLGSCTLLPLALEYTYWDERLPEILISCGEPIETSGTASQAPTEWNRILTASMAAAQDELASLAALRDPSQFQTLLPGRAGIGGVYGGWKKLRSKLTGQPYHAEHGSIRRA